MAGWFTEGVKIINGKEYERLRKTRDKIFNQTAVRLVGNYFLYKGKIEDEDFINHSGNPSLLYHCGVCFARRDIKAGEELTADYRHFLSANKSDFIKDVRTGKNVKGLSWKGALSKSTEELIELLK